MGGGGDVYSRHTSILDSRVRDTIHNEVKSPLEVTYTVASVYIESVLQFNPYFNIIHGSMN